jgi:flagellar biosynthesis protein FlhA
MPRLIRAQLFQPTVLLALALMAIIVMMILPVPSWVLDIGLAASFALAILIFTVTLFIERPLDFSSFPTILLASLMLRLSLNVSSTKLIIGQGHTGTGAAGNVIEGFADFVMGGSVFLGLVVFGVLLIVNFLVITKGAARMAEVGARRASRWPSTAICRRGPSRTRRPARAVRRNSRKRPFSARSTAPRNSSRAMRSPGCSSPFSTS